MDRLARFSDYDVFAYVASGFGGLVVWDAAFATQYVLRAEWSVASAALTVTAAYIIGQILAAPASWIIERQLVHRVLLRPSVVLLAARELGWRRWLKRTILQDYYTPLDPGLIARIRTLAAADRGSEVSGDAAFWCAYPIAKRDPSAHARMDSFLKLYGFSRNLAFVGLAGALGIAVVAGIEWMQAGWSDGVALHGRNTLLALLVGIGMLHRYLKFFRLYSVEIFVTYSASNGAANEVPQKGQDH